MGLREHPSALAGLTIVEPSKGSIGAMRPHLLRNVLMRTGIKAICNGLKNQGVKGYACFSLDKNSKSADMSVSKHWV